MEVGDIFLMDYPYPPKKHYHIVVADINENGVVLLAFISSIKQGIEHDDSCVLRKGDLSFIQHDSYVVYEKLILMQKEYVENKGYKYVGKCDERTLSRVLDGAKKSKYTKPYLLKYFDKTTNNH